MLVLSRNVGERIVIGDDIVITLLVAGDGRAKIGIDAPSELGISRLAPAPDWEYRSGDGGEYRRRRRIENEAERAGEAGEEGR